MIRAVQPYELLVDDEERLVQLRQRCYTYLGSASVYSNTVSSVYEEQKSVRGGVNYPEVLRVKLRKAWQEERKEMPVEDRQK